jgi:hypothetical protein
MFDLSSHTVVNFALHSADPGIVGDQTRSEASYAAYARVAVRCVDFVTEHKGLSLADVAFPAVKAGRERLTHFSIGAAACGAGQILTSGELFPAITASEGVQPIVANLFIRND